MFRRAGPPARERWLLRDQVLADLSDGVEDGLIPLGLILEKGLRRRSYSELPGIKRPVSLLTRKTINQLASFGRLREQLIKATAAYFAKARPA